MRETSTYKTIRTIHLTSVLSIVFVLLFTNTAFTQVSDFMTKRMKANPEALFDQTFYNNIVSVKLYQSGLQNSPPLLELGSNTQLTLSFDIIGSKTAFSGYQYTIEHCEADWKPSTIFQADYISGLYQDYINDYSMSMSTYQPYVHYRVNFPNNNMRPKISGNYILKVYKDNPDAPILQRRFYVYEKLASVGGTVQRATYSKYRQGYQEIDFNVDTRNLVVMDPYNDVKVVLKQNGRWDNEIRNLKPTYIKNTTLVYNYEEENIFPGLNEFRFFDTRDFQFKGMGVKSYTFDSLYNAWLFVDDDRSINTWMTYTDQNGAYTISTRTGRDASNEADYTKVHFRLKPSFRDNGAPVYVFGGLTDWNIDERFRLKFDPNENLYKLDAKLKQGFYDYYYVVVDDKGNIDPSVYEGTHWETENSYTIFVYYRSNNLYTDRLVGIARLNSATER